MPPIDELEKQKANLELERATLFKKREPIDSAIEQNHKKLDKVTNDLAKARVAEGVDLAFLLDPKNLESGMAIYNERQEVLRKMGLMSFGHWEDTKQAAIKIKMTKSDPDSLRQTLEGLRTVAPHVIAHADDRLWFEVFEHTLCEGGVFKLKVAADLSDAELIKTVYRREHSVFKGSLEDVVKYVQENHWYDGGRRDDYDD